MRDALLEERGEAWRGEGGRGKGKRGRGMGEGEGKGGNERGEGGGAYVARPNFCILRRRQWKPNSISLLYFRFPSSLSQFQPILKSFVAMSLVLRRYFKAMSFSEFVP